MCGNIVANSYRNNSIIKVGIMFTLLYSIEIIYMIDDN